MKLIFCPKCQDMVKLLHDKRYCSCKASWGWYEKDGRNAVIGGEAIPIGIDNSQFVPALKEADDTKDRSHYFGAWVFGSLPDTIKREE